MAKSEPVSTRTEQAANRTGLIADTVEYDPTLTFRRKTREDLIADTVESDPRPASGRNPGPQIIADDVQNSDPPSAPAVWVVSERQDTLPCCYCGGYDEAVAVEFMDRITRNVCNGCARGLGLSW